MSSDAFIHAPPTPGSMLADRYRLDAPIANGGMAQVWQAFDLVLDRQVAAKVLHPHLATDQAFLLRFRREAVSAARLSHRSIVGIYDTVSENGVEAIIMELIEGRTMRSVLDQSNQLPVADVIEIGTQVADALSDAHAGGVVHRDIKPSNILLCHDRRVMVTDFGIAKAGEDTDLTVTGTLLGTAKYLSPEQVLGDDVDPRSDLYSLGVVLYEAIAGRPPFRADTEAATALARLHQEPAPLTQFRSDLPAPLVAVVDRLLQREPDDRFERAVDVRVALAALVEPATGPPTTPPVAPVGLGIDPTQAIVEDSTRVVGSEPSPPAVPTSDATPPPLVDEFDEDDDSFIRSERSWLVPALVVCLLGGALVLAGVLLIGDRDDGDQANGPRTDDTISLTPVNELVEPSVAGLTVLDRPELGGDGTENDSQLPLAHDGDNDTVWRSDTYSRSGFAGLKPGLGLLIDLGGTADVQNIELLTESDDWSVQIYVGEDLTGLIDTWGDPVAGGDSYSGREDFDLDGARGKQVMIWITEPGTSEDRGDADEDDDFRFELAEIILS